MDETMDLSEYFYAAGRKAAMQMTINSDPLARKNGGSAYSVGYANAQAQCTRGSPLGPSEEFPRKVSAFKPVSKILNSKVGIPHRPTSDPPKLFQPTPSEPVRSLNSARTAKTTTDAVMGHSLPKADKATNHEPVSSCSSNSSGEISSRKATGCNFTKTAEASSSKPMSRLLNAVRAAKTPSPPVTSPGLPKEGEAEKPDSASSCSSNSSGEIPSHKPTGCNFSKTIEASSSKPMSRLLNAIRTAKTPSPPVTSPGLPKTLETPLPIPASRCSSPEAAECEAITEIWSNLSDCLEVFVTPEVTTDMENAQELLDARLSEALRVVSSKDAAHPPIDVPFDNLLKVCDATSGGSIWNHRHAATEAATSVLAGKTLRAACGTVPHAVVWDVHGQEERTLSVQLVPGEDDGEVEDAEEKLLGTGEYLRVSEAPDGAHGGVTESLTCIRVQDARHFWAYVGSDWPYCLKELDALYDTCDISVDELMGEDGGEIYLTSRPKKGDVLLLAAEDASNDICGVSAVRVRVVDIQRDMVLLWCLDLATYIINKWCHLRRCLKKMSAIPYQARLCQITGLVAKPSMETVQKCCALLLTLLTRWTFELTDATLSDIFAVFPPLCYHGALKALHRPALWCVCVGATLVGCEKHSNSKLNHLLDQYVETIRKLSSGSEDCEETEEDLITATQTVRNLLFGFIELRAYFAQIGGFPVVTQLVLSRCLDGELEMEVWRLLRVLMGAGDLRKENVTVNRSAKEARTAVTQSVIERPSPRLPKRSIKHLLQEWKLAALEEKKLAALEEKKLVANETGPAKAPASRIGRAAPGPAAHQTDNGSREYLIRGKQYPLQPSDTVVMLPQRMVIEIVSAGTIRTVCGLLNSDAGGAIYFGIGPRNLVEGMNLQRKQRDDIRIGFDRLFDDCLLPKIGPSDCDLAFVKVFEPNEPKELDRPQHALHVIRLRVKPSPSTLHRMNSGQYYIIRDGAAVVAITQELRERVVRAAEKQFV